MRKNPGRVAWTVLSVAFVTFWALAIGTPLGIRSFLINARSGQDAQLQVIGGTVLVQKAKGGDPIGVTQGLVLEQGDRIITDATSSATVDLFDRSHLTLYSNTDLTLAQAHAPRFQVSHRSNEIALNLTGGFIRIGVALPGKLGTLFRVITPHTTIDLAEGSYRIEVANDGTQVTVVRGEAIVGPDSARMKLTQGTRSRLELDGTPSPPLPAVENVIENGDFRAPLPAAWITNTMVLTNSVTRPAVEVVDDGGRRAIRLVRQEADNGNHTEAGILQPLDEDVRDFDRLKIVLDVKLNYQSLSGGGEQSSEFPIIVRLNYKDLWGNDKFWTHGFYYQNDRGFVIALDPWGQPFGQQIPRGVWFPYESGNLLVDLGDNKPARITGLQIYSSGWNYDGLVSDVQLLVE